MRSRKQFLREAGLSAAALPFLAGLPDLNAAEGRPRAQRLIILFTPNGTIQNDFWPQATGTDFTLPTILKPLAPYQDRMITMRGVHNKITGPGDRHMRGMSALLTGKELYPGNVQGGSDSPAGWARGISIDQELRNFLQSQDSTRTRFGSLEFGVGVRDRADPWTRMSYAGPNQPVAPIDSPYQMFEKLYGNLDEQRDLLAVLDEVHDDLKRITPSLSSEDRKLMAAHTGFVDQVASQLRAADGQVMHQAPPRLKPAVRDINDNLPQRCRMQMDLLVNAFANDMARVGTLQFTKSVGQARMRWLGISQGHHSLSHDPDNKKESQDKLVRINVWFAEQLRTLLDSLAATPDPLGGNLLETTTVLWCNELGKGNSHTLSDIPFVLIGGGLGFKTGRSLKYDGLPHNRLLLSLAHAFGHTIKTFGNPQLSADGPLDLA